MTHPMLAEAPDVDVVSKFNGMKEQGKHLIASLIAAKGGHVIGDYEGSVLVQLPIESIEVLKEIKERLHKEAGIRFSSIGLGESVSDALVAMKEAGKDNTIKVFRPEMAEQEVEPQSVAVGGSDQPITKAEITPDAQKMISNLVGSLNDHKDYVESLKQVNPEAYESIVEVMQALAAMVGHIKDTQARKNHEDERARLEKVVNSVHDGKFDSDERAILHEILSSMQPKSQVQKAEGDDDFVSTEENEQRWKQTYKEALERHKAAGKPQHEAAKEAMNEAHDKHGVFGAKMSKAEGDTHDVIGQAVKKLHAQIPNLESIRNENPEVFGTYVKMVRLLQALHEDHSTLHKPLEEHFHVHPPAKPEKLTHPKPVYAPGSVRNYNPQSARQKTQDGDWVSVAGGEKRSE